MQPSAMQPTWWSLPELLDMSEIPERMKNARVFVSPQFHEQVQGLGLAPRDRMALGGAVMRISAEEYHPMMRPRFVPETGAAPYVVHAHVHTQGRGELVLEAVKLVDSPVLLTSVAVVPGEVEA